MVLETPNLTVELAPISATEKRYVLSDGREMPPVEYDSARQNNTNNRTDLFDSAELRETVRSAIAKPIQKTRTVTELNRPTDEVNYAGVFGNATALRYSSTFEGFKEDIILHENTGLNHFSFRLTTNGLSLVSTESGSYYLADPLTGECVVVIGDLVITDSRIYEAPDEMDSGEPSDSALELDLAELDGTEIISLTPGELKALERERLYHHSYEAQTVLADQEYILTVVVDENFLKDPETVYPVIIDPTMTVISKGSIPDAAIYQNGWQFWNDNPRTVKVGYDGTYKTSRGLYNPDIFNYNQDFIWLLGVQINSARLQLYYQSLNGCDSYSNLSLYEFNSAWSPSTVKWNNTNPNNYGKKISTTSIGGNSGYKAIDFTNAVHELKYNAQYSFNGFMLKADSEVSGVWKKFSSTGNSAVSSQHPYVEISYNDSPQQCAYIESGAVYYINSWVSNGKTLDVYGGNTTDGTRLIQYNFSGGSNQQFKITHMGNGEYKINPMNAPSKVVSINSSKQVIIETDCSLSRQRWYIYYMPSNTRWHIVNKQNNTELMEIDSGGTYVQSGRLYDQCCWELHKPDDIKYVNFTKINDSSGSCTLSIIKFYNGDFYYQAFDDTDFGELYSLSSTNINWLNNTYNAYAANPGNYSIYGVERKVWMAKDKLINAINSKSWNVAVPSDEFYGLWMHFTRVEVAYADAVHLVAQMVQTAVIIGMTVYQTVVTVKSIGMLVNQQKSLNAAGYQAMAKAKNSFSNMTNSQAVNEGITDTTSYSGTRPSWRQSEISAAESYPTSNGYKYNQSYKNVNGQLTEVSYGSSGSVRPDYYSQSAKKCVDVKNYTITNSTGRSNLANNVANQYNQRVNVFPMGTQYEVMVDLRGQAWTQLMKDDIITKITNLTNGNVYVQFLQ